MIHIPIREMNKLTHEYSYSNVYVSFTWKRYLKIIFFFLRHFLHNGRSIALKY